MKKSFSSPGASEAPSPASNSSPHPKTTTNNNKTQTKLFSFFTKVSSPLTPKGTAAGGGGGGVDGSPTPTVATPTISSSTSIKEKKDYIVLHEDGSALVNKRLKIWWPNDQEWYCGVIEKYDSKTNQHVILYDDGEREILDLESEKYMLISDDRGVKRSSEVSAENLVDSDDDGPIISKKAKLGSKSAIPLKDEEEWAESNTESSESEVELDDSDSDSEKKPKKRKLGKINSVKGSLKKVIPNVESPSLPPRPTKNLDAEVPKGYSQYTASTPSPLKSRNLSSSPLQTPPAPSPSHRNADSPQSTPEEVGGEVGGYGSHEHHTWDFLHKNRKDKTGRSPDHPEYNPRTIWFPPSFLKEQTPAMKQWCEVKADNFDTILFFKVGKFYELFHMDADIGVAEADLIYMKGTKAHSGFPEVSYGKYASILVSKGYKVARIEQTETPEMLKERNRNAGRGAAAKVVSREICSILSKGTRTFCHLDDLTILDDALTGDSSSILMSICERVLSEGTLASESAVAEYGICIVNSVLCTITLAQFEDDKLRNRLRTLICRYLPTEVLLEWGSVSNETLGVLQLLAPKVAREYLRNDEMPQAQVVPEILRKGKYFLDLTANNGTEAIPPVLQAALEALSDGTSTFVVRALGGALFHLKRCCIDFEVMSHGRIYAYVPPDTESLTTDESFFNNLSQAEIDDAQDSIGDLNPEIDDTPRHLILDAVTLTNLEILVNSFDHSPRGSLLTFMNRCRTPFGKRLLKEWVCKPLIRPADIERRRDAVSELMNELSSQAEAARSLLKSCPDLERLLSRVHSNSISRQKLSHPDSRAIMYENQIYNTRKIKDFAEILRGLDIILGVTQLFEDHSFQSQLLKVILSPAGKKFPLEEMKSTLSFFRQIFDEKQAKKDGYIRPLPGVDSQYDEAVSEVADIERSFEEYLKEQKRVTGLSELCYFGTNKDRYQLEVPMAKVSRVPKDWTSKSQKKTHRRYWTAFIESNLAALVQAEEKLAYAQKDTMRRVFEKFDQKCNIWKAAVSCIGIFDALLSLVSVSSLPNYSWPKISPREREGCAQLDIVGGRHPMLEHIISEKGDSQFIANNLSLGGLIQEDPSAMEFRPEVMLVSGPNMGGKSTLLRQTCLIAIMAQIGCRVPADSCILTPVDRIFTRIGASDKILAGQSTFFVELSETAMILKHATQDSLCILDELGRGTSTFDGTAIAHAVVDYIVSKIRCRTLFATHYHTLINDWSIDPRILLGHMDCLVNSDGSDTNGHEEVTFLYRLCDGSSPRSYGLNVARLAKLPEEVVALAYQQSHEFELKMTTTSNTESITGTTENQLSVIIYQFYERLVSVLHGYDDEEIRFDGSQDDLYWMVCELWRRYVHMISRVKS